MVSHENKPLPFSDKLSNYSQYFFSVDNYRQTTWTNYKHSDSYLKHGMEPKNRSHYDVIICLIIGTCLILIYWELCHTGILDKADVFWLPQNIPILTKSSSDDTGVKLGATSYFTSQLKT